MDVAIDGGQTGLRLALASRGRVLEVTEVPGLAYAQGSPADAVLERVECLLPDDADTVCLGLTTLLDSPEKLAARLLSVARRVLITGDVVISHAGAFSGGTGVVLAAGTGAIALGVCGSEVRQVDGWGFLYGDAGSGFWIGRRGLEAACRGLDGRASRGALTSRAVEVFGEPGGLYLAPDAVARVAGFARQVFELAEHDGTARGIVEEAGWELARTVATAAHDFSSPVPVSWTGRLLRDARLFAAFRTALAELLPSARIQPPEGDGLAGAARLAASAGLGSYAPLIQVMSR
jgi:N-acetylglucosamine kinase-like BadF-type ATPase